MGSLFSKEKEKKQKDNERKTVGSAPSRLEGLDGTTPPSSAPVKRALTPDTATRAKDGGVSPITVSAHPESSSPASTKSPTESQKPLAPVPPEAELASEEAAPEEPSRQASPLAPLPPPPPRSAPAPAPVQAEPAPEEPPSPSGAPQEAGTPTRKGPKKIDYVGVQSDGTKLAADLPAAVQVPTEASHWSSVLGDSIVRNLHSPDWKTREHALQAVMRSMSNSRWNAERSPEDIWSVVTQILDKGLKDKVAPLYHAALELLSTLVASYSPQLPYSVLTQGLEPLMPTLLHRAGNNNARIQETSIQALLTLANQPTLGLAFLAPHALSPIPKKSQTGSAAVSQMCGRLELITCMLNVQVQQQMGFGTAGRTAAAAAAAGRVGDAFSAEEIVKFTRPALDMPDEKVRQAAVRVVAEVYRTRKSAGQPFEVEKMLGAGVKPALLAVLHRKFGEVDEELAGGGGAKKADAVDELPVGTGISIKASGNFKAGALPPISGRGGSLPALAVVGSRGGSRTAVDSQGGASTPGGSASGEASKPPRTPLGSAGGVRGRTPPRGLRSAADGSQPSTPLRNVSSPLRGSGMAPLPGFMPDGDSDVMMIQSGTSTPLRGSSAQSQTRGGTANSLRAGSRGNSGQGTHPPNRGAALDDAEEQLIEYILNDEARAIS